MDATNIISKKQEPRVPIVVSEMKSPARPKRRNNTKQQTKTRAVSLAAIGYQSPNKGRLNSKNAGLSYNAPTRWIEEERKMGSSDPRDGLVTVDVKASSCVCLRRILALMVAPTFGPWQRSYGWKGRGISNPF